MTYLPPVIYHTLLVYKQRNPTRNNRLSIIVFLYLKSPGTSQIIFNFCVMCTFLPYIWQSLLWFNFQKTIAAQYLLLHSEDLRNFMIYPSGQNVSNLRSKDNTTTSNDVVLASLLLTSLQRVFSLWDEKLCV